MAFLEWYGSGIIILIVLFCWQAIETTDTIKKAADEVYDVFIRRADMLSTSVLLIAALFGPFLVLWILYFIFRAWQDSLAVDEDDNRIYPWSKE